MESQEQATMTKEELENMLLDNDVLKPENQHLLEKALSLLTARYQKIKDKDCILMIGETGVGKSTLACAFAYPNCLKREKNQYTRKFVLRMKEEVISDLKAKGDLLFAIGESMNTSVTLFPDVFMDKESGLAICDCPGFNDTRGNDKKLINCLSIKLILQLARSVRFLLMVSYGKVMDASGRGNEAIAIHKTLNTIFKKNTFMKHADKISIVVTRIPKEDPTTEEAPLAQEIKNMIQQAFENNKSSIDYQMLAQILPERVFAVDPVDIHQKYEDNTIPTVMQVKDAIFHSPAIQEQDDFGDPLDKDLLEYLDNVMLQSEKKIREKDDAFREKVLETIKQYEFVVPEKPDYRSQLKLPQMLQDMGIDVFDGFKETTEKSLEEMYEQGSKDIEEAKNGYYKEIKSLKNTINLHIQKVLVIQLKQTQKIINITKKLEAGNYCYSRMTADQKLLIDSLDKLKKDQNPDSEKLQNKEREIAEKIADNQNEWYIHYWKGPQENDYSFCQGKQCKDCQVGDEDFQLAHQWENGECTGKRCKTCFHQDSSYNNEHNYTIKGECYGEKCSVCEKPDGRFSDTHEMKDADCLGQLCQNCPQKSDNYQASHDWVKGVCQGKKCKKCHKGGENYREDHSLQKSICKGSKCTFCQHTTDDYSEQHSLLNGDCRGSKCQTCDQTFEKYSDKHDFTIGACSGKKCKFCDLEENYKSDHLLIPGGCQGQKCQRCDHKEGVYHEQHKWKPGKCSGKECEQCEEQRENYRDSHSLKDSICKGSKCTICTHTTEDYKEHKYKGGKCTGQVCENCDDKKDNYRADHSLQESICKGSKCQFCPHKTDDYTAKHYQKDGTCRGWKCETCNQKYEKYRNEHNISKGTCSGEKCSDCTYDKEYKAIHSFIPSACTGSKCQTCDTKSVDFVEKHEWKKGKCQGEYCIHCNKSSIDFHSDHEWKDGQCSGKECKRCSEGSSSFYDQHNFSQITACWGKKCTRCPKEINEANQGNLCDGKNYVWDNRIESDGSKYDIWRCPNCLPYEKGSERTTYNVTGYRNLPDYGMKQFMKKLMFDKGMMRDGMELNGNIIRNTNNYTNAVSCSPVIERKDGDPIIFTFRVKLLKGYAYYIGFSQRDYHSQKPEKQDKDKLDVYKNKIELKGTMSNLRENERFILADQKIKENVSKLRQSFQQSDKIIKQQSKRQDKIQYEKPIIFDFTLQENMIVQNKINNMVFYQQLYNDGWLVVAGEVNCQIENPSMNLSEGETMSTRLDISTGQITWKNEETNKSYSYTHSLMTSGKWHFTVQLQNLNDMAQLLNE